MAHSIRSQWWVRTKLGSFDGNFHIASLVPRLHFLCLPEKCGLGTRLDRHSAKSSGMVFTLFTVLHARLLTSVVCPVVLAVAYGVII